ncbi:hypothetical protein CHU98_g7017 [Xylaria longipes]|nr:hypothetical protein CHU98_g7017 [Xylaria longipes]
MPDPMDIDTVDTALQDLEHVFQGHPRYLRNNLACNWPCVPKWTHQEQGTIITGGLSGLNEVLIVLRRMYAYDASLMSPALQKDNALLQLSCKLLDTLKPDDPLLLKVVLEQLGRNLCIDKDPSFLTVLHHDTMRRFWHSPRLHLFQTKRMFSKSGNSLWQTINIETWDTLWTGDLSAFKGQGSMQQFVSNRFRVRQVGNIQTYFCCNFPQFLRVHYAVPEPSDGLTRPKYKDLQSFDLTAPVISKEDMAKPNHTRAETKMETYHYSLIACVFERNGQDDPSEVRTYALDGQPFLPDTDWDQPWEKRIGTPNTKCFLFYARCEPRERPLAVEVAFGSEFFNRHTNPIKILRAMMGIPTPTILPPTTKRMRADFATQDTSTAAIATPEAGQMTVPSQAQQTKRAPTGTRINAAPKASTVATVSLERAPTGAKSQ